MAAELDLSQQISDLLAKDVPEAFELPVGTEAYAWRLLRWDADVPLTDEQRTQLTDCLPSCMQPAGVCGWSFSEDGDMITILLCCTHFPAAAHRETVLWLCAHALLEQCSLLLEQEGTMAIGEEFSSPTLWRAALTPMREISDWWAKVSPIPASAAHTHRAGLQTLLKRRQFANLGGYVTRVLRTETEVNRVCFAMVPLIIEAVWSQHAEISLRKLTEELNLNEMTRKPKEALLSWIASLQPRLRACPTVSSAAEPIDRVIAGIQADCSLPYSQANLSHSLGLTPAYFCRLFHEKTGMHFSAFLTSTRMNKAQELLSEDGEKSLQDVAQACGYPNKSYFCQVFKKYTGMTPGEFEQQCKNV